MIKFNNVKFKYKTNEYEEIALDNINLHIKRGEFVAVIGHNGSGKSTLAKHINGILIPDEGTVTISDLNTANEDLIWEIRKTAGMVFQNPDNQIVATIVEDDVAFGPENLGIESAKIRNRIDEALQIVDMHPYFKKPSHLLSGGQKQRVAIAGVLAMKPDCIVFDEPTSMLDPVGKKEVMDIILKLNKEENITIVLITHFMEEAIKAGRVIVMEEGKIILNGTPKNVFKEVDKLKDMGLDVPLVTSMAHLLIKEGFNVRKDVLTIEEMVNDICQLL